MLENDLIKEYKIDIGKVQVFDNFMVAILHEGITLTLERTAELIGISEIHFRDKDFGYITLRENSYAIDPTLYTKIRHLTNLKAFAIVSTKEIDRHNYKIEKHFYGKKMAFFETMEEAIEWVKTIV